MSKSPAGILAVSFYFYVLLFFGVITKGLAFGGFSISLPESSNSGFSDIKIALCNVNNEVYEKLQSVIDNGIVLSATVDLRIPTTLVSDWSMTLDVKGLAFNEDKVQITASANDILNCEFPKLRYSALTFPGLKYLKYWTSHII